MKRSTTRPLQRLALSAAVAAALLAGCSSLEVQKQTVAQTHEARLGPQQAPFRSITGFSNALRCMDNLFIDYGIRDVTMLVEDIADQTKKVNAGTRDMLITAVSDMTRRSRALRINAFGKDASNVISLLASAQRHSAYEVVPQYDIKGSVSQFDENVIRNQKDFGVGFSSLVNLGIAKDAASSILGLDLSVLTTGDMTVLPGVTSRNSVVILKRGKGLDGDAAYHKFGLNFSLTFSQSEGQSQALRGLVELAVIELMGKLTRIPYWSCLGADPSTNEEIKIELSDWYYAMASSRVELIGYFQNQLRRRGFYDGPIDGRFNPAIDEAIAGYRAALGLSRRALLDEPFFRAYLGADHSKITVPNEPARFAAVAPAAAGAAPKLALATADQRTVFAPGEAINLSVRLDRDAHVYCYLQDENARVVRFYPNRFAKDSLVSATKPLLLPGAMRFRLSIRRPGAKETIACFATPRDVLALLPQAVAGADFEPLANVSLDQVRSAFAAAAAAAVAQETIEVQAR